MKTRLLIVDDSVVFRMFMRKCLMGMDDVDVVGVARDGVDALAKVEELKPDVITLDMNMPRMNGMETLEALRRTHRHIGIIIVAAETEDDADRTVQALRAGAFDFILKPQASDLDPAGSIRKAMMLRLKEFRERCVRTDQTKHRSSREAGIRGRSVSAAAPVVGKRRPPDIRPDILAIGSSTGGPAALQMVIPKLPAGFPMPVVVVQHMPELFIRSLASRMNKESALPCKVAEDGERLMPGCVYFAPGGWHTEVEACGHALRATLSDAPPLHFCRPAVDATFKSLVRLAPLVRTLAVVLTGMGKDGAAGALALADCAGYVIAQDEATSTVWGMPGTTVKMGAAHRVLPLEQISGAIVAVSRGSGQVTAVNE